MEVTLLARLAIKKKVRMKHNHTKFVTITN